MKNGAYFVKQKTRTQGWAPPGRLSGLCTLALGLALTRILSTPAAGFSVDPDAFDVVTELVSINQAGTDSGNGSAGLAGLSENGRFVGFVSDATDLVATDTNGEFDVFVRDLKTGTTTLVSVNQAGTDSGNGFSPGGLSFSENGRFVAFMSGASDLVATDTNGEFDVFVRDLKTGTTTLVSVNRAGTDSGNSLSQNPVLSADGHFVAFASEASDLVAIDTNGTSDIFVRDLKTGTTTLVSVNQAGTDSGNGISIEGYRFSENGRFVGFVSGASDLVATDTNGTVDVFVRDLKRRTTTLVSVNQAGTDSGNEFSGGVEAPALSADGRFVAFRSLASDLVATDTNGADDVFVRDLKMKTTTLVSVNRAGTNSGNSFSGSSVLSADGRFVAFRSLASDLVATDTNGQQDVFVRDLKGEPPRW